MNKLVYPAPLYSFLSILERSRNGSTPQPIKILDCAAGGKTPPLGLFHEYGYETWGIDISPEQVQLAQAFGEQHGMSLNIRQGDMRQIPFGDETFDHVFEYHSIAHLTKVDTGIAIDEMWRVLKKGGMGFIGFMSLDSWPILGHKVGDNEFCLIEGDQEVVHSAYRDHEPDRYFPAWTIIHTEKHTRWFRQWSASLSLEDWMQWFDPQHSDLSRSAWEALYPEVVARGNTSHTFYVVQKPE